MQSKQVCVQLSTSADNVALPAFADEHRAAVRLLLSTRQQPIDTFCLPGPQQQTRSCKMRCTNEIDRLTDKQTGGWTLYHYTDPAPHRMKKHVMIRDVKTVYFSKPVTGLPKPVFYRLPKGLL